MMEPRLDPHVLDSLRRALRHSLAAETGAAAAPPDLRDVDPAEFLRAARRHRVQPLLVASAQATRLPESVVTDLAGDTQDEQLAALLSASQLTSAVQALSTQSIPSLAIKGVALAASTTGDYTARGSGDIDIWVRPGDVAATVSVLAELGYEQFGCEIPTPAASWNFRYALWLGNAELAMGNATQTIDLHWRLDSMASGLPDFTRAWSRRASVEIGNASIPTLSIADAFVYACRNAAKDEWESLRTLVDVYRLLSMLRFRDDRLPPADSGIRRTLAVTEANLGLPPNAPAFELRPKQRTIVLRIADRAQRGMGEGYVTTQAGDWYRRLVGRGQTCRSMADAARVGAWIALPPSAVTGESPDEHPGLGLVASRRLSHGA
ncbi:MAG: nucleotidyltransferase family protein, partial [Candidatus Nanopelagicales bacterium]|nr:nucleotidyltransferase family protein [Candidatus Nanopelagicales bacterium]